jgi:L-ascorbate metabolism protein UlaG (beta-lactamase superfamily)
MSAPLAITWVGHSTVLLELDGMRVLTDPVLHRRVGPLMRIAPAAPPDVTENIDAVLISHLHADHADPRSLKRVSDAAAIVGPRGTARFLSSRAVHEVEPGDEVEVGALRVSATDARHDGRRHPLAAPAETVGFVVHGTRTTYFAGDTDLFDEMRGLKGTIDVALLPVWGWGRSLGEGHLDPERAAEAARRIAPRVAIPIHWGTLAAPPPIPRLEDQEWPAREFAALVARRAPGVEARVLAVGERTEVA